jgi:hypothetical protein
MFFGDGDRYNANRNGQTPCKAVTYNANLTWTFDSITQGFVNCFTKTARGAGEWYAPSDGESTLGSAYISDNGG